MQTALIDVQFFNKRVSILEHLFPGIAVHTGKSVLAAYQAVIACPHRCSLAVSMFMLVVASILGALSCPCCRLHEATQISHQPQEPRNEPWSGTFPRHASDAVQSVRPSVCDSTRLAKERCRHGLHPFCRRR